MRIMVIIQKIKKINTDGVGNDFVAQRHVSDVFVKLPLELRCIRMHLDD